MPRRSSQAGRRKADGYGREQIYKNGVISGMMHHKPILLEDEWFLQDPDDWLNSMCSVTEQMLL